MPELPEVETVRRGLEKVIVGATLTDVEILEDRCFEGQAEETLGATIEGLDRRGKCIRIIYSSGWSMLGHLRMTGQMIFVSGAGEREGGGHPDDSLHASLPHKHTRVILRFGDRGTLYFNDQRKFGYLKLVPSDELHTDNFWRNLGPEPWDDAYNADMLRDICQRRAKTTIKAVLLDQHVVAGLGNIYVDETLFLSGIRPKRKAGRISKKALERVVSNSREVLERGIAFGGVSVSDYVNAEGLRGTMQQQLYVYNRAEMPCKVCGTPIEKITVAGRGTHYCPKCQR